MYGFVVQRSQYISFVFFLNVDILISLIPTGQYLNFNDINQNKLQIQNKLPRPQGNSCICLLCMMYGSLLLKKFYLFPYLPFSES